MHQSLNSLAKPSLILLKSKITKIRVAVCLKQSADKNSPTLLIERYFFLANRQLI